MTARSRSSAPRTPSLARTLAILTAIVVALALGSALGATWYSLRQTALAAAQDRVERAARQIASAAAISVHQTTQSRYRGVARDGELREILRAASAEAGREGAGEGRAARLPLQPPEALANLVQPSDTGLPAELWSSDGRLVAVVGDEFPATPRIAGRGEVRASGDSLGRGASGSAGESAIVPPREGIQALVLTDSLQLGTMHSVDGRVHFWIVMPVMDGNRPLGFIIHRRRIVENPRTDQLLTELGGGGLVSYYRSAKGDLWTTLGGVVATPPEGDLSSGNTVRRRPRLGELVYAEAPIGQTPIVAVLEMPRTAILARSHFVVRRLAILSVLLTAAGAVAAWLIGRHLTRPLVELTKAAESVAAGDFDTRVKAAGTDEVARLGASFNNMASQVGSSLAALETASRAKSDFLATMSHELRTPLNAIGGYVELLEMELRGPITELQRRDLTRIRHSQQHLLSLISAVLDLTRFETGRVSYELTTIAVDPLLAGLDALVEPQAVAKNLTLRYEAAAPGLAVVADREKLRQVLLNLLSNAIRYTPPRGTVTLGAARASATTVAIVVYDDGPGIPAERQEEIFEPFVQLDRSLTQSREGVGLGLAISRDLARGMGGDLTVDSRAGEGARFTVTLPLGDAAEAEPRTITEETVAQRGVHVAG